MCEGRPVSVSFPGVVAAGLPGPGGRAAASGDNGAPTRGLERARSRIEAFQRAAASTFEAEYGRQPSTPEEIAEAERLADIPDEYRTHGDLSVDELAEKLAGAEGAGGDEAKPGSNYLAVFEAEGLEGMQPDAVQGLIGEIRDVLESDDPLLSSVQEDFLEQLGDSGYAGESDGDPVFQWIEHKSQSEGNLVGYVHQVAEELMVREREGEDLAEEDRDFLRRYRRVLGNRFEWAVGSVGSGQWGAAGREVLANAGWSDAARAASLAVRRAKRLLRMLIGWVVVGGGLSLAPRDGLFQQELDLPIDAPQLLLGPGLELLVERRIDSEQE